LLAPDHASERVAPRWALREREHRKNRERTRANIEWNGCVNSACFERQSAEQAESKVFVTPHFDLLTSY